MFDKEELGDEHFEEEHGMTKDESSKKQTFFSFSVLNGFKCFFRGAVLEEGLTYHQCY